MTQKVYPLLNLKEQHSETSLKVMYYHKAYGLSIDSCLALPELQACEPTESPDLTMRFGSVSLALPEPSPSWRHFYRNGDLFYCYWTVTGTFLVRDGREITIDLLPNVDPKTIRLPLLGPILAMVLHQRRQLSLHASAVAIDGEAVLFLGASGQGKSTTAAALHNRGHQLVTDDVAAISFDHGSVPYIIPGFPRVKLWPQAVTAALSKDPNTLQTIHPDVEKVTYSTASSFSQRPLPIKRIFILATGASPAPKVVSLSHKEAVARLTENAYIPMVLAPEFSELIYHSEKFEYICQCVRLANKVSVVRLERPSSLELLSDLASLIENELEQSRNIVLAS